MGSILEKGAGEAGTASEAEQMATLLKQTVQTGLAVGEKLDLQEAGEKADSIRLALAALAAPLIGQSYKVNGKLPDDSDRQRIVKALEATLLFADNFAPTSENTARLAGMNPDAAPRDESQATIQYMTALVPVINAVGRFSFGQTDHKLAQDIADRLSKTAQSLCKTFPGGAGQDLPVMAALVRIYVSCHQTETERLMAMNEEARTKEAAGNGSMDKVWEAFDTRVKMLEVLGNASPAETSGASQGPTPEAAPPPLPPVSAPAEIPPVAPVAPPPAAPAPVEQPPPATGGNPMSFFKPGAQKPAGESDAASTDQA